MRQWILLLLLAAAPLARADSVDCWSFAAAPSSYSGPQGTIIVDGNTASWTVSFTVSATFTNNCIESRMVAAGFGSDVDPFIADAPWGAPFKLTEFYEPFYLVAPGESVTLPFAWYVWAPDAPPGYSWTSNIFAEGWGESQFTATVDGPAIATPEPATLTLLITGIGIFVIRKRAGSKRGA